MVCDIDAPVFSYTRSLKAASDIETGLEGKIVGEKPSQAVFGAIDKVVHPVRSKLRGNGIRSSVGRVLRCDVENIVMNALRSHKRELHTNFRVCRLVAPRSKRSEWIRC